MDSFVAFISRRKVIFSVFLLVQLMGTVWAIMSEPAVSLTQTSFLRLLSIKTAIFLFYVILAYLTFKNIKVVTWIMSSILMFTGCGSTLVGLFSVEWYQGVVKILLVVTGIYFMFGSISLLRSPGLKEWQL